MMVGGRLFAGYARALGLPSQRVRSSSTMVIWRAERIQVPDSADFLVCIRSLIHIFFVKFQYLKN
jgi:hypothetical protein